jgi:hypothetical protein
MQPLFISKGKLKIKFLSKNQFDIRPIALSLVLLYPSLYLSHRLYFDLILL